MKNIDLTEVLAAARGEVPADIVLKGGCIFNSFTGEWEIGDVAIVGETIWQKEMCSGAAVTVWRP